MWILVYFVTKKKNLKQPLQFCHNGSLGFKDAIVNSHGKMSHRQNIFLIMLVLTELLIVDLIFILFMT